MSLNKSINKDIKYYFDDKDDKNLNFTTTWKGLKNLIFDNGIFKGNISNENRGEHFIHVTATDPYGSNITVKFILVVLNFPPKCEKIPD